MRVLYFAPMVSEGVSLPVARTLEEAFRNFAPLSVIDASREYGIDTWDELNDNRESITDMYDALLLATPKMSRKDRILFFDGLRRYTASASAKPVVGYFNDPEINTSFNLVKSGAAYAHRAGEHVGVLALYLQRAAALDPASLSPAPFRMGPVVVNYELKKAFVDGASVKLSAGQFDLLEFLARRKGRPYDQEMLMLGLNKSQEVDQKIIDVIVCQVRNALSDANPEHPQAGERLLRTLWGRGYFVAGRQADYDAPLQGRTVKEPAQLGHEQRIALPAPKSAIS